MKETLFRGKRKDNREWAFGDLIVSKGKYYIHPRANAFQVDGVLSRLIVLYEVIPETVSQFTGLVDKYNKKIFEGDLIAKGFELYEVRWNPEQVRWGIYSDNYEVAGFTKFSESYFAVVGNIYDDKGLLEND